MKCISARLDGKNAHELRRTAWLKAKKLLILHEKAWASLRRLAKQRFFVTEQSSHAPSLQASHGQPVGSLRPSQRQSAIRGGGTLLLPFGRRFRKCRAPPGKALSFGWRPRRRSGWMPWSGAAPPTSKPPPSSHLPRLPLSCLLAFCLQGVADEATPLLPPLLAFVATFRGPIRPASFNA